MTRQSKQLRGVVTRTRLIVAAIDLLAAEGFSAVTMGRVAELAEVSAGPRQYYFPTPGDLFAAVVEHIEEFCLLNESSFEEGTDYRYLLTQQINSRLNGISSSARIAMFELDRACRGDGYLNSVIGPKIKNFEALERANFLSFFTRTRLPESELLAIRAILVAASGALNTGYRVPQGIENLQKANDHIALAKQLLVKILADYIENRVKYGNY